MKRVIIVGPSGAGKTTLARRLSKKLAIPHVELDQLWWRPGWKRLPNEDFEKIVRRELAKGEWVMCGNYSFVREVLWSGADTIIWLNYSFALSFWRCLKRTMRRIIRGECCCNGNRESFSRTFFSRDSVLIWMVKNYIIRKRIYPSLMSKVRYPHLKFVILHSPRQTETWLKGLQSTLPERVVYEHSAKRNGQAGVFIEVK